jgi:hypothetical protein
MRIGVFIGVDAIEERIACASRVSLQTGQRSTVLTDPCSTHDGSNRGSCGNVGVAGVRELLLFSVVRAGEKARVRPGAATRGGFPAERLGGASPTRSVEPGPNWCRGTVPRLSVSARWRCTQRGYRGVARIKANPRPGVAHPIRTACANFGV